jgi:hypothetical protein
MPRKKFVANDPRAGKGPKKGAPNAGRPRNEIRAKMREGLAKRLSVAFDILDDKKATPAARLAAMEFLAKYGLGAKQQRQRVELTGKNGGPVETKQTLQFGDQEVVF